MKVKVNTIISLSNQERYMVLNETTWNQKHYFLVMGIDEKKEIIQSKVAIFEEILEDGNIFVEKVEEPKLIIELTNLLKAQL